MSVRIGIGIDVTVVFEGMKWAKQIDFSKGASKHITIESFLRYTLDK